MRRAGDPDGVPPSTAAKFSLRGLKGEMWVFRNFFSVITEPVTVIAMGFKVTFGSENAEHGEFALFVAHHFYRFPCSLRHGHIQGRAGRSLNGEEGASVLISAGAIHGVSGRQPWMGKQAGSHKAQGHTFEPLVKE